MSDSSARAASVEHRGGCHCGAVRFSVWAPARPPVVRCNCSICRMSGYLHLIVTKAEFVLHDGQDALCTYSFKTRVAKHLFCRHCGIKSFYVPRSHPDGYSVNINCLEPSTLEGYDMLDFDGGNWEAAIHGLRDQ